jgi:uncharacterized low-complexity protein
MHPNGLHHDSTPHPFRDVWRAVESFNNFDEVIFMNKQQLLSVAIGSAFAAVTLMPVAHAANPFAADTLQNGYQVAQTDIKKKDGKCGEGKCGAEKKKDGKCGEGKCGADKKKDGKCGEGKCGGDMKKKKDGKCGEGKCGAEEKKS